jgi:hypothetical protein
LRTAELGDPVRSERWLDTKPVSSRVSRKKGARRVPFIQIVEFTTADIDAVRAIDDEWTNASKGKRTARRQILTQDRNNPERYLALVFFDSYESAMYNSKLPETATFSERFRQATKELTFHDLDVIGDKVL